MKRASRDVARIEREQNIEILRKIALLLWNETEVLHERLRKLTEEKLKLQGAGAEALQLEIDQLKELLARREREMFGPSSEKRPRPKSKPPRENPSNGHGPRQQPQLPIVEVTHELGEDQRDCPQCGGKLGEMGDQAEESEEITVVERSFRLVRHRRKKYRCRCNASVVTAPGPPKLIPGGRYSPEFAVEVAIAKYLDHSVPRRYAQLPKGGRSKPCRMEDEGWPLGIGVQAQVPNHLELRGSRARVVSVEGKGAARPRQVRSKKTSASEPLMTCREVSTGRRNRAVWLARDEPRESLLIDWVASGMEAA